MLVIWEGWQFASMQQRGRRGQEELLVFPFLSLQWPHSSPPCSRHNWMMRGMSGSSVWSMWVSSAGDVCLTEEVTEAPSPPHGVQGRSTGLSGQHALMVADCTSMTLLSWPAIHGVGYSCPYPSVAMLQLLSVSIHFLLSTGACARHRKETQTRACGP